MPCKIKFFLNLFLNYFKRYQHSNEKMKTVRSKSSGSLSDNCLPPANTSQLIPENISIAKRKERLFGTVANNNPTPLSSIISIKPMSHQPSVSPTDKAFEDLCITSNDQIMNYPSNSNLFSIDSLEVKNATELPLSESKINGGGDTTTNINNPHKINSKLLYEIIHAEIDDPQLSLKNVADNVKIRSCSESTSARSYEIAARNYEQRLSINKNNQESHEQSNNLNGPCLDNDNLDDDVFLEQESITKQKQQQEQRKSRSVSPSRKSTSCSSDERQSSTSTSSSFSSTTSLTSESKKQPNAASVTASNAMGAMGKSKHVSTGTTLEISSYTFDSLFNSNLLTPMYCSDTLVSQSPQLGSLLMKSPLLQPNSPAAYRLHTQQAIYNAYYNSGQSPKSLSSFNFNSITPQQKRHFFQPTTVNNNEDSFGSLPNATKPPYRSPTFNSTSPTALIKTHPQGIA
jgi:hypothetical protein